LATLRKIIHIDMDAFFASVEQRDNPTLHGKPVAVGGSGVRGVVAAASYEARRYGVKSALSSQVARRRCPNLIFVRPRFEVYKAVSLQIREIFLEYTNLVEPLSLDEAYLDVTQIKMGKPSATLIAREIKERIRHETGLTASAGVSYNKFLAKMASDINKPDGLFVITPNMAESFINSLEVGKFHGIGKVTAKKLNDNGIFFGSELRIIDRYELIRQFGKAGNFYYDIVRGIDERPVEPIHERKSLGAENTFETDLFSMDDMIRELDQISHTVWQRIEKTSLNGKTLTLKIKFSDFEQITRSKTMTEPFSSQKMILDDGIQLLKTAWPFEKGIRLMGLTLSNFMEPAKGPVQLVIDF
jgi:DNA polymerase-4